MGSGNDVYSPIFGVNGVYSLIFGGNDVSSLIFDVNGAYSPICGKMEKQTFANGRSTHIVAEWTTVNGQWASARLKNCIVTFFTFVAHRFSSQQILLLYLQR
jgi:hypothetical protein